MSDNDLREQLAALAHEQWAGWMNYLFSRCEERPDGSVVIPPELAERWNRQAETPYDLLSETEKDSDRSEADRVLTIVGFFDGE